MFEASLTLCLAGLASAWPLARGSGSAHGPGDYDVEHGSDARPY